MDKTLHLLLLLLIAIITLVPAYGAENVINSAGASAIRSEDEDDLIESKLIILGSSDNDSEITATAPVFTETDIIPVTGGGAIITLRGKESDVTAYRFNLGDASLVETLNALSLSIFPDEITIPGQPSPKAEVIIRDESAYAIRINIQIENSDLAKTLDLISIASACNIYLELQQIIVDLCSN